MKIIRTNIMRGPNYWSNYRKYLIVLNLDLEEFDEVFSNQLPGFNQALKKLLPSLYEHRCSIGQEGGFLQRLETGTLLGHVIEHVALELQTLAGMEAGYGRVRESNEKGIYYVVYSYLDEEAGLFAGQAAFELVYELAKQNAYLKLPEILEELKDIWAVKRPGPSTEAILKEAQKRHIPFTHIHQSLYMLGYGTLQKLFSSTVAHDTSCIGVDLVHDKNLTKAILKNEFIPTPDGKVIETLAELKQEIEFLKFPIVLKPQYGNHGRGITTQIETLEKAKLAFKQAQAISRSVIIEKYIAGDDFRFLVINFKFVAAAKRTPPSITGNGNLTVRELITLLNEHPHRGKFHENFMTQVKMDEATETILKENNLTLDSVLPINKTIILKTTANISTGATSEDVTDEVHPDNIFLAERIARLTNLNVCGIDLIAKNISVPIKSNNGMILEVNAGPGFRMHLAPQFGQPRNVAESFLEMHFPAPKTGRIPIIAVTGTNGKTTVVRLIAHLATEAHYTVGMTTTEGIYINNQVIFKGDCSGPRSAAVVLRDPMVNFAVLECARGGILRSGLAFDECQISIITNISEDHLGQNNIHTLEQMAKVKSVVAHSTQVRGYAILNAEDDLVYALKNELTCQIALFSTTLNSRIEAHIQEGKKACYLDQGMIYIADNQKIISVLKMETIPITLEGLLDCMQQNVLPAILAGYLSGFNLKIIIDGLKTFLPTPDNLPGRINFFKFPNCTVMLDYAHNEKAYLALKEYLAKLSSTFKIGIIAGTGDRRDDDIKKTGSFAAQMFDKIIIRHDQDSRGRTHEEITDLILEGIYSVDPKMPVQIIPNEFDAIEFAIAEAKLETFIWYFPDHVLKAIKFLQKLTQAVIEE